MSIEARKESLRYLFDRVVQPLGYKFSPTRSSSTNCSRPRRRPSRTSARRLPCQGRSGVRAEDMQICCPCIPFDREHFDAMKRCWCGLFVDLDVTDPDSLPQFPPDEV